MFSDVVTSGFLGQLVPPRPQHLFGSITGGCGSHNRLQILPIGIGLVVNSKKMEETDELSEYSKRYLVKQRSFDLGNGMFANMRLTTLVEPYQRSGHPMKDYMQCNDKLSEEWEDTNTLIPVTGGSVLSYYPTYGWPVSQNNPHPWASEAWVKWGQSRNTKDPDEFLESVKEHLKGKYLFFVHIDSRHSEACKKMFNVVYETPMYTNRTHEYDSNYLISHIVKI